MNLLQLRTKAVQLSGRYDLVVDSTDWDDNGMDFYINSGVRMLERLAALHETKARLWYNLPVGEYSLEFQHNCRVVHTVWASNTESRWQLTKLSNDDFFAEYSDATSQTDNGTLEHFTIVPLRALETTDQNSLGTFLNASHLETDKKYDYYGILLGPPTDEECTITVSGLFKSVELSANGDESFWTIQEPDLTLRAALYQLEIFSRGTEDAKNWLSAIQADVLQINFDIAEEESYTITQLKG